MKMATIPNQSRVNWNVDGAQFIFETPGGLERWQNKGQPIYFEFDAFNADDGGEAVLKNTELLSRCLYYLTPKIAEVRIEQSDDGPIISAEIEVLVQFKGGLTQDDLHDWNLDLGGIATATISIDDDAYYVTDEASWFELANASNSEVA